MSCNDFFALFVICFVCVTGHPLFFTFLFYFYSVELAFKIHAVRMTGNLVLRTPVIQGSNGDQERKKKEQKKNKFQLDLCWLVSSCSAVEVQVGLL